MSSSRIVNGDIWDYDNTNTYNNNLIYNEKTETYYEPSKKTETIQVIETKTEQLPSNNQKQKKQKKQIKSYNNPIDDNDYDDNYDASHDKYYN